VINRMAKKFSAKNMDEKDLKKNLNEKREELRQAYFDVAGTKAKNVKHMKSVRRDIARIMTELSLTEK